MQNNQNVLLATVLSAIILISWMWIYEKPKLERQQQEQEFAALNKEESQIISPNIINTSSSDFVQSGFTGQNQEQPNQATEAEPTISANLISREEAITESAQARISILNNNLHGSIYLKGARFDDLTLANYYQTIDDYQEVSLLSPYQSSSRYFADFGWVSSNSSLDLPKSNTIWQADKNHLSPQSPVTLSWKNSQNILFSIHIAMDEDYMFSIEQVVKNLSKDVISLASYGRINRILGQTTSGIAGSNYILHEGAIGVFDYILQESDYKELSEEKNQYFEAKKGWFGITDKYWLTSIIPDKNSPFKSHFSYLITNQNNIYNTEFVGQEFLIAQNAELKFTHHFFAGAKEVTLLDQYSNEYDINLFDRAVDFGWYYFLTKPFFFILKFFNDLFGNYGLAILAITILIKALLFPLANKSYSSMGKIKQLQPKITAIRDANKNNKMQMNKEIMAMYKREKINPASGCLPMLIQIPIFFSLYKVLFVTIDMRHQPFYGWIKDLSAPDPTSIFNLFGLLPFETHGMLTIGVWPILMGLTMILQQKLGPKIADAAQAKVMQILPFILIFVFAAFPAGLLIYWTWSNVLSIAQQWFITNKLSKNEPNN